MKISSTGVGHHLHRVTSVGRVALGVVALVGMTASSALANCGSFASAAQHASATGRLAPAIAAPPAVRIDAPHAANLSEQAVTGLWETAVSVDGQVIDQAFETFTSDGNELMIDTAPPALDNVCNGVWANVGRRAYKINHPSWTFADDGVTLTGRAIIKTTIVLSRDGNSFTGTSGVLVYDTEGHLIQEIPPALITGKRVTVD